MSMSYALKIKFDTTDKNQLDEITQFIREFLYEYDEPFDCVAVSGGVNEWDWIDLSKNFPTILFTVMECKTEDFTFGDNDLTKWYFYNGKSDVVRGRIEWLEPSNIVDELKKRL